MYSDFSSHLRYRHYTTMVYVDAVGPKDTGSLATLEDEKDAKLDKRWKSGGKPTLRGSCGL